MRRLTIGVALVFLALATPGVAGQGTYMAIEITSTGGSCFNGECTSSVRVTVSADKRKCVADRKVKFYALYVDDKA